MTGVFQRVGILMAFKRLGRKTYSVVRRSMSRTLGLLHNLPSSVEIVSNMAAKCLYAVYQVHRSRDKERESRSCPPIDTQETSYS
jgi:hypothetical protein